MTKNLPYLAMDGVLCDYPLPLFGGKATTKKEPQKMKTLSADQLTRYVGIRVRNPAAADRYWARCMGQDAVMDDEIVEKLKAFLQSKLSSEDHAAACAMMDGSGAQDTEPPPDDVEGKPAMDSLIAKREKDRADFYARFPEAARIKIDTSGLPLPARGPSHSAEGTESFFARFPDARRIKIL